jgi:hypothetical protein
MRSSSVDSPEDPQVSFYSNFGGKSRSEQRTVCWQPDESSSNCVICEKGFNLIRRRHHCRACGKLICDSCSRKKLLRGQALLHSIVLGADDLDNSRCKQRVCSPCSQSDDSDVSTEDDWEDELLGAEAEEATLTAMCSNCTQRVRISDINAHSMQCKVEGNRCTKKRSRTFSWGGADHRRTDQRKAVPSSVCFPIQGLLANRIGRNDGEREVSSPPEEAVAVTKASAKSATKATVACDLESTMRPGSLALRNSAVLEEEKCEL